MFERRHVTTTTKTRIAYGGSNVACQYTRYINSAKAKLLVLFTCIIMVQAGFGIEPLGVGNVHITCVTGLHNPLCDRAYKQ